MEDLQLEGLFDMFDPEEMEKRSRETYERAIKNPNLLSFWYPKITEAGILTPSTLAMGVSVISLSLSLLVY